MSRGRATLARIDREIAAIRGEEAELAQRVEQLTQRLSGLREEELAAFRELARFRLGAEAGARVSGLLDRAEAQARKLIADRNAMLAGLDGEISALNDELSRLNAERHKLAGEIAEGRKAVEQADATLILRLAETEAYKTRLAAAESAEKVAVEAERKAELARTDRVEKGRPYEADPLFMYLWRRGYGTHEYRSRGLIRMLDDWVAGLVRYHEARPNYYMLLELPERLGEHAASTRKAADAEQERLDAFEAEQRARAGVLDLEQAADEAEKRLGELDQAIAAKTGERSDIEARRAAIQRGEDEASRSAIDTLAGALQDSELAALHRAALLTPEPEDERLVARIDELRDEIEAVGQDLDGRRNLQRDLQEKLRELEQVRARFVGERYDDDRWDFDDNAVDDFLKALLRGAINGAVLWDALRRRGRYTPGPTRPGPWGSAPGGGSIFLPGRGRGGGFRLPGGFGRGGFRTGGGFGGGRGGFRTGGSF